MKIYVPTKITTEAEAEALPEGITVLATSESEPAPFAYTKHNGVFVDWQGHSLTPSEIVPTTALVEHEVYGRVDRAYGAVTPGLLGGATLVTGFGGDEAPHERMVWSTEWKKSEDQG